MSSARFDPAASEEFGAAAIFYEKQQSGLGARFITAVEATVARIEQAPTLHRLIEKDIRKVRVRRFPYGVVYRIRESIEIIAVMHLQRRPGYWQERTQ